MITDKEYPATHSMATSWYMVDEDGNVGIMQFDDNGPVPFGIVQDCDFPNNLLFGEGFDENEKCGAIHLTESQIHETLGNPHTVDQEECWFGVVVKIDKSREEQFHRIIKGSNIENCGCVSKELGLYKIDASDCTSDNKGIVTEGSALHQLMTKDIIQAVYDIPNLDMDCVYDSEAQREVFTKEFGNNSYYLYLQPYWPDFPQKRMNTPAYPVKLSQIDESKRGRLLYIPGKFDDMEYMQIARWFPCEVSGTDGDFEKIGSNEYTLLPMEDGSRKYILTSTWFMDFYPYCPLKTENGCVRCCHGRCASAFSLTNVLKPTVLHIMSPRSCERDYYMNSDVRIFENRLVTFSYMPKFPYPNDSASFVLQSEVVKYMTDEVLTNLFKESHAWLDSIVSQIRPWVLLVDDNAYDIFSSVYSVDKKKVNVDGSIYDIFKVSEIRQNKDFIQCLSAKPYRGQVVRQSLSEEEVKDIMQL